MSVAHIPLFQELVGVSVQVGSCDVFQGVVLEWRWGWMELPSRIHEGESQGRAVPRSWTNGAHSLGRRLRRERVSLKTIFFSSVWTMSLPISIHLHQQLRGVGWGRGVCVQQDVLMLGQVLGRRLLGSPGAVQQLPLQQGKVGLQKWNHKGTKREVGGLLELAVKFLNCHCRVH